MIVTVDYRLGVFGFFAHPERGETSNFGLQDQVAALRWVRMYLACRPITRPPSTGYAP
ncbi:carboxylesterase family protein [Microbispora sp. KK1-11]|uniref:carboxylesterase family protein n=1 Tax=Microbispora sp. KK1-11 TaxID=2053005 RepID=UPI0021AE6CE8|nr:carboxylesterase family protein [Microbispora sp. KK1-11]